MTMVLGADPDAKVKDWPDDPKPQYMEFRAAPPVRELTEYFAYHRSMKMSQRCNSDDKVFLNRYFARKLQQGYTSAALRKMVDYFWQSWGSDSQTPALAFTSTKMQEKLIHQAEVVKNDDVLDWIIRSMPDDGPFQDNREMRKAVILAGDCILRYPDVVASILRIEGTLAATRSRLSFLNEAIEAKVAGKYLKMDRNPLLPDELQGPGPIRPLYKDVNIAIANIPLRRSREV